VIIATPRTVSRDWIEQRYRDRLLAPWRAENSLATNLSIAVVLTPS
jgi:hypothetical protein